MRNSAYMVEVDRRPRMFSNPGTDLYEVSWVVDTHRAKVAGAKIEDRKFNKLRALKLHRLRVQLVFRARRGAGANQQSNSACGSQHTLSQTAHLICEASALARNAERGG